MATLMHRNLPWADILRLCGDPKAVYRSTTGAIERSHGTNEEVTRLQIEFEAMRCFTTSKLINHICLAGHLAISLPGVTLSSTHN